MTAKAIDIAMYKKLSPWLRQKAVSETAVYSFGCSGCTRSFCHGNQVTHCEARRQICVCEMVLFREWFSVHSLQAMNLNNDELPTIRLSWTEFCNCFKIKKIQELCVNKRLSNQDTGDSRSHRAHYDVTVLGQMGITNIYILYKIPFQRCHMSVMVSPITGYLSVC